MNNELTVVCVYWKGKFRGRENVYSEEWVYKLENMVSKNLNIPYKFVCLTNVDLDTNCIKLSRPNDLVGWWSKMELFRRDLFTGRVLYLDLDLVILDSLIPFVEYKTDFGIIKAFGNKGKEKKGVVHGYNSSVMVWDAVYGYNYFDSFINNWEFNIKTFRGDQDFIAWKSNNKLKTFPSSWVTKLRYLDNFDDIPNNKIILCMPGKNKNAVMKFKWMKKIWK